MKNINSYNVTVENFGKNLFIGYVKELKGLVVQGRSKKEILKELEISLIAKITYDDQK